MPDRANFICTRCANLWRFQWDGLVPVHIEDVLCPACGAPSVPIDHEILPDDADTVVVSEETLWRVSGWGVA